MSTFAVGTPAPAAPTGGTYHPNCYTVGICIGPAGPFNYQVTASTLTYDVGPTPYYISIFEVGSGERLALCGRGTECTADPLSWTGCHRYVAYVGGAGTSMPPEPVQRTSELWEKCFGAG